jgi:hypothetical protein
MESSKQRDYSAGIFKQSMGSRNQEGIVLLYRPARLHKLAALIPWNRFLGSLKVKKFGLGVERSKGRGLCPVSRRVHNN